MNAKQLKDKIYPAEMSLSEQSKNDRKKAKRFTNDHTKKPHVIRIPEFANTIILAESEEKCRRMEREIRVKNNLNSF